VAEKIHFKTINDYLNSFPREVRLVLQALRKNIKEVLPQAQEKISYNIPAFSKNGKIIIYYAAWKKHISLYPFSGEMLESIPETSVYKTSGKGTIQFPLDKPLPWPLIRKIVEHRANEVLED
jgi:uncharacterized protein YdhG (YjbR/CyaY superfamily)